MSVSAGFAVGTGGHIDEVIQRADRRLYRAKELGRARLVTAGP